MSQLTRIKPCSPRRPAAVIALGCALATLSALPLPAADAPSVFASGLQTPSKIIFSNGYLYATEAGSTPNSGRISVIGSDGVRRTVLEGLPSGPSAPNNEYDGPNGVLRRGNVLFVLNGEGDTHQVGTVPNTIIPNVNGPSSPLYATLLRVTFSESPDTLTAGFTLALADHFTIADGSTVTLDNGAGQTAKVQLVTAFRPDRPDPRSVYRNTHLYGLAASPVSPQDLYVADAGNNAVWHVNLEHETPRLVTRFPNTTSPTPPPPTSEAVPTSVRAIGSQLLVSLLSGAPFAPGASRVMLVDPATGTATTLIPNLTSTIDVYPVTDLTAGPQALVLEFSTNLSAGAPGKLLQYSLAGMKTLADGLTTPVSLAVDRAGKTIFILDQAEGTILKLPLP